MEMARWKSRVCHEAGYRSKVAVVSNDELG